MAEKTEEGPQDGPYDRKERTKYTPDEEARLEREHFWRIIDAFRYYRYITTKALQAQVRQRKLICE